MQKSKEALRPEPATLFEDVLKILLNDTVIEGEDEWPPTVNIELIEALLLDHGEFERAQDIGLMEEMAEVAASPSGRLDIDAFIQALTSDLKAWEAGSEGAFSTFFYDVFHMDNSPEYVEALWRHEYGKANTNSREAESRAASPENNTPVEQEVVVEEKRSFSWKTILDQANIDHVTDAHSSVFIVFLIWCYYIMVSFSYATLFQSSVTAPCEDTEGKSSFGCLLAGVLWSW